MEVIYLLMLLGSAACFFVVAFMHRGGGTVNGPRPASRVDLVGLGLLLWVLVSLVQLMAGFEV